MANRKPEEVKPGAPEWQTTFSDLMNLLLCFFVLLFSMSSVDTQKFQELSASLASTYSILPNGGASIGEGVLISSGASQLNELSEFYSNLGLNNEGEKDQEVQDAYEEVNKEGLKESESMKEYIEGKLENQNIAGSVEVTATSKFVMLKLNGEILYDSGKAELKPDALKLLDKVADIIYKYDNNIISVEGHTDNVPIKTSNYPNNMMLSLYRAHSVYEFLVNEKGFDAATLSSSGRGDSVPVAGNDTLEGRAQNRRVEIKIYNSINSINS